LLDEIQSNTGLAVASAGTGADRTLTLTSADGSFFHAIGFATVQPGRTDSDPDEILVSFAGASGTIVLDGVSFEAAPDGGEQGVIVAQGGALASLDVLSDDDTQVRLVILPGDDVTTFTLNTEVDTVLGIYGENLTELD